MDPYMVQEKQETEGEKDREDQEKKEVMEEDETEEKMEEGEASEKKKPEEDREDEKMEGGGDEETAEASILEPEEGEEEGGEELDPQREEKLLEEDEVGQDSHDGMDSEEILRNFVKSDTTSNSGLDCQSFPDLTINSPKDNMSDDDNYSHTLKSQPPAYDPYSSEIFNESYYYSTKPEGSTLNYQDEPTEYQLTSSITDPPDNVILEAEEQEVEEKEVEEEEQEKEDSTDEDVLFAGEVKVDEKEQEIIVEEEEQEITTEGEGSTGLGGPQVASKDCRTQYKEVIKAQCNPYPYCGQSFRNPKQ